MKKKDLSCFCNKVRFFMKQLKQGLLVAFEGIDGSGKSTVCRRVYEALTAQGYSVVLTKEPGGTELGQSIRTLVQRPSTPLDPLAEFLLFAADRAQHMQKLIKPALAAKKIVLCDRMADSSVAYQGYGRGLDVAMINKVNDWALAGVKPELTLYLEVSPTLAQERIAARHAQTKKELSAFDAEQTAFFARVAQGYSLMYQHRPDVCFVDAQMSEQECFETAYAHMLSLVEALHE